MLVGVTVLVGVIVGVTVLVGVGLGVGHDPPVHTLQSPSTVSNDIKLYITLGTALTTVTHPAKTSVVKM